MKLVFFSLHFVLFAKQLQLNFCGLLPDQTLAVKILSESAFSRETTLVYQTLHENFVIVIQQKKK